MDYKYEIKTLKKRQEMIDNQLVELGENLQRFMPLLAQTIAMSNHSEETEEDDQECERKEIEILGSDMKIISINEDLDEVSFSCKVNIKNNTNKALNINYTFMLLDEDGIKIGKTYQILVLDPHQQLTHTAQDVFEGIHKIDKISKTAVRSEVMGPVPK